VKRDGRPHLSPNLFFWDGERFFISTTRDRVKYKIFSRDPRVELIVDDATGHRYVRVSGTVEVLEDIPSNLPMDRAIREKHGIPVAADDELAASLVADNRVLLAVTPAKPVGCQNAATASDLRFQAAGSYSLRRPPRMGRRRILPWTGSGTGDVGRGGRSRSARCGRAVL
jgi:PPOX class probable F420-dependent enzyme